MIDIDKNLIKRSLLEIFNKYGYGKGGMDLMKKIGMFAGSIGYNSFLIGGFVRDVLIYSMKIDPKTSSRFKYANVFNAPDKEIYPDTYLDLDIVIEGNAERFAKLLREKKRIGLAINSIKIHKRFGTASIEFSINGKPLKVDLASTRTETYRNHGALPAVSIGGTSLKDDVFRRDFTINTLSFSLKTDDSKSGAALSSVARTGFLAIKDYAGGLPDILNKKIRVLHDLSFKEDPTRILRAVRFEKRLGFNIENHTETLIEKALEAKVLDNISGKRIMSELNLLLREKRPWVYFDRLKKLGVLKGIDSRLEFNNDIKRVFRHISLRAKNDKSRGHIFIFYIAELLHHLNRVEFNTAIGRLALGEKIKKVIESMYLEAKSLDELREKCVNKLYKNKPLKLKNSEIYLIFKGFSENGILFYLFKHDSKSAADLSFKKWAVKYIDKIRFIKPMTDGNDIKSLGICEGPLCGSILEEVKLLKMDGRFKSRRAEIFYIKNKYVVNKNGGAKK